MALTSVFWSRGFDFDIHVVRGTTSRRLDDLLALTDSVVGSRFANNLPPGYGVHFDGLFAGAPAAHGVSVNAATGAVTATIPAPPAGTAKLRILIVQGTITEVASGTSLSKQIRFHIHELVTRIWATPATLTVRQNADAVKLTVLAEFDDHVIGDITEWAKLPAGHISQLTWSASNPADVDVQADGTLLAKSLGAARDVTVTIGPQPAPINFFSKVRITVGPPWTQATPLTFVDGAGSAQFASVPNILFLPDGFTTQGDFDTIVRSVVHELGTKLSTLPFNLLKSSINYWSAWVPSVDAGVGTLSEMGKQLAATAPNLSAEEVPYPSLTAPAVGAATWTLKEMIYEVGLPVRSDAGRPLTGGAKPMLTEFVTLFGAKVTQAKITGVFADWLALNTRLLLNERNTSFGHATGERPKFTELNTHRGMDPNPNRMSNADFDRFFNALTHAAGAVGKGWVSGGNVAGLNAGKDRGLVVVVCFSRRSGGLNTPGRSIGVSTGDAQDVLFRPVALGFDRVTQTPMPTSMSAVSVARVAHECAHAPPMLLEDEYGTAQALPAGKTFPNGGNVQEEPGVRIAGALNAAKIKWQWDRIEAAGVLTSTPVPAPAAPAFRVTLPAGQVGVFANGDQVRLRTRPLVSSTRSAVLTVTAVEVATNSLLLNDVSTTLTPNTFPAGSIVYRPKHAVAPPNNELTLVAPRIAAHINASNNPLNAAAAAAGNAACVATSKTMQAATNIPAAIRAQITAKKRPRFSAWLVGLYEGGNSFFCGIYHPTGTCLMRSKEFHGSGATIEIYQFCTVCRYLLVDALDPTKHGDIDALYDPRYPDP